MPFLTAGDPDIATTEGILRALGNAGADLCEVGVPYSDPVADGPIIQDSYQRSLNQNFRLQSMWEMGKNLTADLTLPLVTMVSYAIVYRVGLEKYVETAKAAGFAGAIIPDLLVEEADAISKICQAADFSLIQLVTPTTPRDRQLRIAESSSGFLYYVSVTGITGERRALPSDLIDNVRWLGEQTELPICIGFGISDPETAAQLAPVCDGLIVGSAIVRRIADAGGGQASIEAAAQFVTQLRTAIDTAQAVN